MKYYVYQATGLDGVLLYIGKGTGGRLRHCSSGISHCLKLNRYFFEHGKDSIHVEIVKRFETNGEALQYENFCISSMKPLFNRGVGFIAEDTPTDIQHRLKNGYVVDFGKLMKLYLIAVDEGNVLFVDLVNQHSPDHRKCLDILGLARIKRIGYNKTKLMTALNRQLKVINNEQELGDELRKIFKVSQRYSLKAVVDVVGDLYGKYDISLPAKSTTIKNFFSVKDVFMTVNGKRSKDYLILDDLYKENVA